MRGVTEGTDVKSLALLPLAMVLAVSTPASAGGNPHFIRHATTATLSDADLVVNFKETGLAAGATESITTSATATTTYECVNGGGHNPSASNKTTPVTDVSQTDAFTADRNGNLVGSPEAQPTYGYRPRFLLPAGSDCHLRGRVVLQRPDHG